MNPLAKSLRRIFSFPAAATSQRLTALNSTRATVLAAHLEVADTATARNKGLLGRKGLATGEGLWIIPCEAVHTFGMQFAIDLVYLDRRHVVRKVRRAVPASRISVCLAAHSILELPAGTIEKTGTEPGDKIEFQSAAADRTRMDAAEN